MLSEKIASLRVPLQKFLDTGVTLTPTALTSICVILRTVEIEAKGLEHGLGLHTPDPATAIGLSVPDNVVQLFKAPDRQGGVA
jgi:hypothetical protein